MPSVVVSVAVMAGPTIPPSVPPTPMNPKRRLPWPESNASAMKPQKTDTTNRLKTLVQI